MAFGKRRGIWKRNSSRGLVKRAKGSLKSAKSASDIANFTVSFTHPFVLSGKPISIDGVGTRNLGVQALNVWDLLSRAPNFQAFQKMYDQVRIDYIRVKLQVTNSTISTANAQQLYDIYTAWDRNGVDLGDTTPIVDGRDKIIGIGVVMGSNISQYNGVSKMQLNAFQRWMQYKSLYPRTLMEKGQFVSTSEVTQWRLTYDTADLYYPFISDTALDKTDTQGYMNYLNQNNPGILVANSKYPFKPTLLVGGFITQNNATDNVAETNVPLNSETKIVMTAEFSVALTFRGLKGAPSIS